MNIRIFDKPARYRPKETVSYVTNDDGELVTVRTPIVYGPDPSRVAVDFLTARRHRGYVEKYFNGAEVDLDGADAQSMMEAIELAGFDYDADGITVAELADEVGASQSEVIGIAGKLGLRLKAKSTVDPVFADGMRNTYKASRKQRGAHFPGR